MFYDIVNMDEGFYFTCLMFLAGDKSLAAKVEYSRYLLLIAS